MLTDFTTEWELRDTIKDLRKQISRLKKKIESLEQKDHPLRDNHDDYDEPPK